MSVEERRRIRLFERWVETWGQEDAEAMLELFPPPGRNVATSEDIIALDTRITALETKIETVRTELQLQIQAATAELTAVVRAEIQRATVAQTRITIFSMVTAFAAVSALALGLG